MIKVRVEIQFDIGNLILHEICWHAQNVYSMLNLPHPSLIFQILFMQNDKVVKATQKYEKMPPELKFSHKWIEGKQAPLDLRTRERKKPLLKRQQCLKQLAQMQTQFLDLQAHYLLLIRSSSSCFLIRLLLMKCKSMTSKLATTSYWPGNLDDTFSILE